MFNASTLCTRYKTAGCALTSLMVHRSKCNKAVEETNSSDYTPIYKFNFIRAVAAVNQLKRIHTITTAVCVPSFIGLYQTGICDYELTSIVGVLGISGCFSLYSLGFLTNKFIGMIYMSKNQNAVRFAVLDFWGRRRDVKVALTDILPLSDAPEMVTDRFYLTIRRYSSRETYKMNLKWADVLDKDKFNKVFCIR